MKKSLFFMLLIVVILLQVGVLPSQAETQSEIQSEPPAESRFAEKASLSDLIAYAYEENPSIHSAKSAWKSAVEQYRVATGYPDPQLMITYFPRPIETRLGPQDWNANITQMIPLPGKLSKAGEIAEADARLARLNLDKTVRDITVSVLESFYELTYIREAKRIAAQNVELLDHLRKVGETAYAQDRTAFTDVVRAQSQTAQLRYDMLLLDDLEHTETTRLNGLLNRDPGSAVGSLEQIPFRAIVYSLEEIYRLAEVNQEEIQMAEVQVQKADAQAELEQYQNLPEFRVGLFYAAIGNPDVAMSPEDAGRDAVGIQFGMSIPLWFGKNSGRMERVRAEAEKFKSAKTARVVDIRSRIHQIFFRLQNAQRLISLYRDEMLPQAANAMKTAETWFAHGEGSFSDFAETQAALYNFQLSLARSQADYGKYLARLEQLTGQSLTEKENVGKGEK